MKGKITYVEGHTNVSLHWNQDLRQTHIQDRIHLMVQFGLLPRQPFSTSGTGLGEGADPEVRLLRNACRAFTIGTLQIRDGDFDLFVKTLESEDLGFVKVKPGQLRMNRRRGALSRIQSAYA